MHTEMYKTVILPMLCGLTCSADDEPFVSSKANVGASNVPDGDT
jgi:hypothetical protein